MADIWTLAETAYPPDQPAGPAPTPLAAGDILFELNAADTTTWSRDRATAQAIIGGDRFNPGVTVGNLHGLTFEADGTTINSFTCEDGTVHRLATGTHAGVPVMHGVEQWVNAGNGYDPAQEQPNGTNPSVTTPPSDELFFDGTRIHYAFTQQLMTIGSGATPTKVACGFVVEDWMQANDWTTGPWELHTPGAGYTSPVLSQLRQGELRVFSRDSLTPIEFGVDPAPSASTQIATATLPAAGSWAVPIFDFAVDPGGAGYFDTHMLNPATSATSQVGAHGNGYGYLFDDPALLSQYYNIMQVYNFHQFTPAGVTWNWDDSGGWGNTRHLRLAFIVATQAAGVTVADMASHARYRLGLS